jgi:hypothetical protein
MFCVPQKFGPRSDSWGDAGFVPEDVQLTGVCGPRRRIDFGEGWIVGVIEALALEFRYLDLLLNNGLLQLYTL